VNAGVKVARHLMESLM